MEKIALMFYFSHQSPGYAVMMSHDEEATRMTSYSMGTARMLTKRASTN